MTEEAKAERRARMAERKAAREAAQAERDDQRKKDEALVLDAMRAVLTDPEATSAQRIYAVAVLENMQRYHFVPYDTRNADALIADFAVRLEAAQKKDTE